jgi:hypothetical protein
MSSLRWNKQQMEVKYYNGGKKERKHLKLMIKVRKTESDIITV